MKSLEDNLKYTFKNPSFLKKALAHPSALPPGQGVEFERLEFLGDRVLGLVIASWLFKKFPKDAEGDLAKRFTNLVRKEALLKIASIINLQQFMLIKHETSSSQKKRLETLLADGCEALIGALYLDGGLEVARSFIHRFWDQSFIEDISAHIDPKSALQEWSQGHSKKHPHYSVLSSSGPAHAPHFIVQVHVEGFEAVKGEGSSKRLAEKDAALHLLNVILTHD
ncbi:MAG: hypothetical protein ACD_16C00130G0035 [uncultured bacterium]|nr:MAG: hypothetical protein ACD_16C00130G0035 [uncultured bacterium]OFW69578.1 MAG: ribonuclease III [Alphaproteobacteria bacterium GWC2_42_16]OFW74102.1 MAG: ribonuclease III [Alphaproteobacteria bacterium GWA2_41_27]OFW84410.1 MAG: ribonuclease III [Alphaproteobacteria bacterium RIFCSPHIGHO2_12_FULL_42_100]OFW85931.1 MAG: ribonuclease III [Alphaproteobacteria bacterium RBG_16_42_14]OFW92257.1 MAG: ribonuclease III [Alphaproteobacteria bacterium RIFCSPHIGHO2_02_FULL_42_30]OFW92899.1 MAG: ri